MSTNCERPVSRYQPPDWHERNYKLANTARATREQSHNLRKEAQLLKVMPTVRWDLKMPIDYTPLSPSVGAKSYL